MSAPHGRAARPCNGAAPRPPAAAAARSAARRRAPAPRPAAAIPNKTPNQPTTNHAPAALASRAEM